MAGDHCRDAPKLPHSLQTYLGMVTCDGRPKRRYHPPTEEVCKELGSKIEHRDILNPRISWKSPAAVYDAFTSCLLDGAVPNTDDRLDTLKIKRFRDNMFACRDSTITNGTLKRILHHQSRLDLEQVAAAILSVIVHDETLLDRRKVVSQLVHAIESSVLTESFMWLEAVDRCPSSDSDTKFENTVALVERMTSGLCDEPWFALDWSDLLPILLQIRRSRPRDHSRCLYIPEWIFDKAGATIPPYHSRLHNGKDFRIMYPGVMEPSHPPDSESIILPRKAFRGLQRRLLRYFRFWEPKARLSGALHDLEADTLYCVGHFRRQIAPSDDTLLIASHFIAIQRRLQRKIVSDIHWTTFLKKGQSAEFIQNTPTEPTAFELVLQKAIQERPAGGSTVLPITNAILPQIDQCCLLMEEYVKVYGNGDKSTLVFKPGSYGGSGRGCVDEYNLLCSILARLREEGKKAGIQVLPGPVRKFLAKDIMAWNRSWEDDAFAGGFTPGWEPWLKWRRSRGTLLSEWEVMGGSDVVGGLEAMEIN